jgi:hypothetical protein
LAPNSNNGNSSSSRSSSSGGVSTTSGGSEKDQIKLVEYTNNAVVVWHNQERLSLDLQTYNLQLTPVRQWDHGEYICLANDRRRPDAVIHLIVHGKRLSGPFSQLRTLRFRANQSAISQLQPFAAPSVRLTRPNDSLAFSVDPGGPPPKWDQSTAAPSGSSRALSH